MNFHKTLFGLAILLGLPASAADTTKPRQDDRQTTIDMHEKMAERHRVASDCIKANRPVADCNKEAMKDCPMAKSGMCPFMGEGGMMGGKKKQGSPEPMKGMRETDKQEK